MISLHEAECLLEAMRGPTDQELQVLARRRWYQLLYQGTGREAHIAKISKEIQPCQEDQQRPRAPE
jgi:hypothetical protein